MLYENHIDPWAGSHGAIYNSMDLPELMRRVLEVAPPSIREAFDDHKALTNALKAGDADRVCSAITAHANQVRIALADFLADTVDGETGAGGEGQSGVGQASSATRGTR